MLPPASQHEAARQLERAIMFELRLGHAVWVMVRQPAQHQTRQPQHQQAHGVRHGSHEALRIHAPHAEAGMAEGEQVATLRVEYKVANAADVRVVEHYDALVHLAHVEEPQRAVAVSQQHGVRIRPRVRVQPLNPCLPSRRHRPRRKVLSMAGRLTARMQVLRSLLTRGSKVWR